MRQAGGRDYDEGLGVPELQQPQTLRPSTPQGSSATDDAPSRGKSSQKIPIVNFF